MYADTMTPAMTDAIEETDRRRAKQIAYNKEHGITPATVKKAIRSSIEAEVKARKTVQETLGASVSEMDKTELIQMLEQEMLEAAQNMEFERAAQLRDKVNELKGAPTIKSANGVQLDDDKPRVWQPKSKGKRGGGKKSGSFKG
jgi:excinuclease ABC subunit B